MRIGLINGLHGDGSSDASPTWKSISKRAELAEEVGFDLFVFEDSYLYTGETSQGVWESMAIAAAISATTRSMQIAHSVINSPYRSPSLVASAALTLDEISGGRYTLGIGAGNTADSDYAAAGVPSDFRFSRFAEAIEIIHGLLKEGAVDFDGQFYSVSGAETVLRRSVDAFPPINIAAGGPRMMDLVARFADEWNWWAFDETVDEIAKRFEPILESLDAALDRQEKPRTGLVRTIDLYSVLAPGSDDEADRSPVSGDVDDLVEYISGLASLGFEEVRCDVLPQTEAAVEAMAPVVARVHDL